MATINNNQEIDRFTRAVEEVTAFPLLTEEVGTISAPSPGSSSGRPTSFDTVVQSTLRDVLGWRPNGSQDARGFIAALEQSFTGMEASGRTQYSHVPRSYIMQVQADGGAVTGAQASIYARAKAAMDQSLPLLEGLYPLHSEADSEDLAAVTSTVRLGLTQLVEELGRSGGPRPQRIDSIFDLLLGPETVKDTAASFNAEQVEGQLGLLRQELGLADEQVNTAEEEKNLTNFLILADYVFTLLLSWRSLRGYFDRGDSDVFLGPQLVLLSRALAVVAESVRETYFTLDSVFVGPAERETTLLRFQDQPPLTLAELLEWTERFSSEEAPRLIQEAGKLGVIAFRPTLDRLAALAGEAAAISRRPTSNPAPGVHHGRVTNALTSLHQHLVNTKNLALPLRRTPAPLVQRVEPGEIGPESKGKKLELRIEGQDFQPNSQVRLDLFVAPRTRFDSNLVDVDLADAPAHHIPAKGVHFGSSSTLWAAFDPSAFPRDRDTEWSVAVTSPDGTEGSLPQALKLDLQEPECASSTSLTSPEITEITPTSGAPGSQLVVTITGKSFKLGAEVAIEISGEGHDIEIVNAWWDSETTLEAEIEIHENAKQGERTLYVINPDKSSDETIFTITGGRRP